MSRVSWSIVHSLTWTRKHRTGICLVCMIRTRGEAESSFLSSDSGVFLESLVLSFHRLSFHHGLESPGGRASGWLSSKTGSSQKNEISNMICRMLRRVGKLHMSALHDRWILPKLVLEIRISGFRISGVLKKTTNIRMFRIPFVFFSLFLSQIRKI